MNTFRALLRAAILALSSVGLLCSPAFPGVPSLTQEPGEGVILAAANCNAIGQQVASQEGGQVASAALDNSRGQPVCVIVVVVPPKENQRGKRIRRVVPAN